MRDRNEKAPEAAGADLVPIPIGLAILIHVVKVRTESINTKLRYPILPFGLHTITIMAWNPKELHRFWRRMLGMDEKRSAHARIAVDRDQR